MKDFRENMKDFKENIKEIIWDDLTREEITKIAMNWWGSLDDRMEKLSVTESARNGVHLDRSKDFRTVTENDITNIFWWHLVWGVLS